MDSFRYSRDLPRVSLMSHRRSRDFDKLFFKLLLVTFSNIASLDLDKYRFLSDSLSLQVWQDLREDPPAEPGEWCTLSLAEDWWPGAWCTGSGSGIFSISGDGEGGSEWRAIQECCRHALTLGRSLHVSRV